MLGCLGVVILDDAVMGIIASVAEILQRVQVGLVALR